MPNPNAIVGRVLRLDPPLDDRPGGERAVIFHDDRRARLDPNNKNSAGLARILENMGKLGRPVYLESDPGTGFVKRLLLPDVSRVARRTHGNSSFLDFLRAVITRVISSCL